MAAGKTGIEKLRVHFKYSSFLFCGCKRWAAVEGNVIFNP
jgi:hypothetical protein